ncbi:hypothetical protein [Haloarchaeobius iranensis]|uniref:Uncharacterized protein n=1 Tax=Haloarchaeobius iranensis TaxID=996166 RepID=A0A1G9XP88_9EURY|nr:hypothetical protein [Haloarchaeobius iranensis]SDM98063.1 hypothetical protein SAMN05192554_11142 [Haloarchaeobius iranensis]
MDDALPTGWVREYEGRNGAEYFHEPRELALSILPRYDSHNGRASEMTASAYLVRVHRLFGDDYWTPLTLGRTATLAEAKDLALAYMQRLHRQGDTRTEELAAIAGVAPYTDDLLVRLVRTRSEFALRAVAHRVGDDVTVAYERDDADALSANEARTRCRRLARALVADGDAPASVVVSTGDETLVYVAPPGEPAAGSLFAFDPDARLVLPGLLDDLETLLARRQRDGSDSEREDAR